MAITFRSYEKEDIEYLLEIWNDILADGNAFPNEQLYTKIEFKKFLNEQDAVTCMLMSGELAGFYILHPNHIGRCSHVANAGYAMSKNYRGRHLGKALVEHSLQKAKLMGFKGMQFNAVVSENIPAIRIYNTIGFKIVGTIPEGFRLKNEKYTDMHVMYKSIDPSDER